MRCSSFSTVIGYLRHEVRQNKGKVTAIPVDLDSYTIGFIHSYINEEGEEVSTEYCVAVADIPHEGPGSSEMGREKIARELTELSESLAQMELNDIYN